MAGRSRMRYVEPDALRFLADDAMTQRMDVRQLSSYGVRMVEAIGLGGNARGGDPGRHHRYRHRRGPSGPGRCVRGRVGFCARRRHPRGGSGGPGYAHGTRMAGVIAAADTAFGVVGVAPGVSLYALKAFPASGGARTSDIIRALQWAVDHHLDVVNCRSAATNRANSRRRRTGQRAMPTCSSSPLLGMRERMCATRRHTPQLWA